MAENPVPFCVGHEEVRQDIREVKKKQGERPCLSHEEQLKSLKESDNDLKEDNKDQWTAINQLRRVVWMGAGAAAFAGSVVGNLLISYLVKR